MLLDIGDDVGALVVTMPPAMVGDGDRDRRRLAALRPTGTTTGTTHGHDHGHAHRPHVAVVDRPVAAGTLPSLVFPELVEGSYDLFDKGEGPVLLTAPRSPGARSPSWSGQRIHRPAERSGAARAVGRARAATQARVGLV